MPVSLVLIDHHKASEFKLYEQRNAEIILANDAENFFENISGYVNRKYDLVYIDQNLDSMISSILYLINSGKDMEFRPFTKPFQQTDIDEFEKNGISEIFVLNSFGAYRSDLELFEKVVVINPHETGLDNIPCSQLLYKSLEKADDFMRDLAGIAIVADYGLSEALNTMILIIRAYPELFKELNDLLDAIALNKWNILDSLFQELVHMLWAPIILYGKNGVTELISAMINNPPFTYLDISNRNKDNTAAAYLLEQYEKFNEILENERKNFNNKVIVHKNIMIYEPEFQSANFIREFSNLMKDEHLEQIIMMKVKTPDEKTKYSLRRGLLEIDLGEILEGMGVGGGNPFAAGCVINDPDVFEKQFIKNVNHRLYGTA